MDKKHDNVQHPSHYETGKFECIEVMEEALGSDAVKGFCLCNAFKYIYRHNRKNGDEDIEKAIWYLNHYMKIVKSGDLIANESEDITCDKCDGKCSKSCTDNDEANKLFDLFMKDGFTALYSYHDYLEKVRQDPLNYFTKRADFNLGCRNCVCNEVDGDTCPGIMNCKKFESFCKVINMDKDDVASGKSWIYK